MVWDLESGDIPQEYFDEDERLRCVEGREVVQLSGPSRLGLGWVWDHEEKLPQDHAEEQQEFTCRSEEDDEEDDEEEKGEGKTQPGEEGSDSEEDDMEYDEGENVGEEVREELAWLEAHIRRPE
ncbi:uncharacterized protein N0V89_001362 [Didymosphaeria variabile]|uniref:Uncharacterized protein n=1 Tax=Didymosphaeria variabile TaxID=1932322 RepID=A0A9W8XY99_9PLEO|nr:uncharacterized protein N0V89_001362 [Didymosphaeria variabile]KAJ4360795.1 hypothetical protein N0V89_001362 [Didymosphaeria variabile]